ncbi:MAG: hypothetical protein AABP62_23175 [Planctomycetota bacterium]
MDHMRRPKATVLPESAMVPDRNIIQPPPTQFTHEVVAEQPYYYIGPHQAVPPEGTFPAGTKVVVLTHDDGPMCQVVDGRGLCVVTAFNGLRPHR